MQRVGHYTAKSGDNRHLEWTRRSKYKVKQHTVNYCLHSMYLGTLSTIRQDGKRHMRAITKTNNPSKAQTSIYSNTSNIHTIKYGRSLRGLLKARLLQHGQTRTRRVQVRTAWKEDEVPYGKCRHLKHLEAHVTRTHAHTRTHIHTHQSAGAKILLLKPVCIRCGATWTEAIGQMPAVAQFRVFWFPMSHLKQRRYSDTSG